MFNLILWILIVVILVRIAKLIGAKTNEVKQNGACGNTGSYFFFGADAKISAPIMEEINQL